MTVEEFAQAPDAMLALDSVELAAQLLRVNEIQPVRFVDSGFESCSLKASRQVHQSSYRACHWDSAMQPSINPTEPAASVDVDSRWAPAHPVAHRDLEASAPGPPNPPKFGRAVMTENSVSAAFEHRRHPTRKTVDLTAPDDVDPAMKAV